MTRDLAEVFALSFGPADHPLGLAVSGGGDSVAMLCLAAEAGLPVAVVTVDHGLRPESAGEAVWVADLCRKLDLPHDTLRWQGWDGTGNLQDQARRARLGLMADWARARRIPTIALAHTRDDQAETVLMRLARRSGVDGLSAMSPRRDHLGVTWARPLLGIGRQDLRDWLSARGQDWIEDPSNEALRFDRVKAREALRHLEPLGISPAVLADVASQMRSVRQALDRQTVQAARRLARIVAGDVSISRDGFLDLPPEIARRLMVMALRWIAPGDYAPRMSSVAELLQAVAAGEGGTLAGCRLVVHRGRLHLCRELQALAGVSVEPGQAWDGRWRLIGPAAAGLEVRALGPEGLAQCPGWRDAGLPRPAAMATPGVWQEGSLLAAPLLRREANWRAEPLRAEDGFFLSTLSH